jgi:hypothetical protein
MLSLNVAIAECYECDANKVLAAFICEADNRYVRRTVIPTISVLNTSLRFAGRGLAKWHFRVSDSDVGSRHAIGNLLESGRKMAITFHSLSDFAVTCKTSNRYVTN